MLGGKKSSLKTNHRGGLSSGWSFAAGSTLWKERKNEKMVVSLCEQSKCTQLVVFVKKILLNCGVTLSYRKFMYDTHI